MNIRCRFRLMQSEGNSGETDGGRLTAEKHSQRLGESSEGLDIFYAQSETSGRMEEGSSPLILNSTASLP